MRALEKIAVTGAWGLFAFAMIGAGASKLAGAEMHVESFAHFGLPTWLLYFTGAFEVLTALLLIPRSTRFVGAVLGIAVMVGGVLTHLQAGDSITMAVPALVLLALAVVTAVAHRSTVLGGVVEAAEVEPTSAK